MKYLKSLLLAALILAPMLDAQAQSQRSKTKAKTSKTVATKTSEDPSARLFRTMLPATAKVMFVDSMVVPKANFMQHIPLPPEAGSIFVKNDSKQATTMGQYENGFRDRKIFAVGDTLNSLLLNQTLLGNEWSDPLALGNISDRSYMLQNYPYLCSDGITLFFSATGPNSLGGRDIFMTAYDRDNTKWYEPQNYGMPFNSTANDYMMVIDDLDSLGWLVSDRFQKGDSVCIYTFVPTTPRQDFSGDDLDNKKLESLAKIDRIQDTWKFGDRAAAIRRERGLRNRKETENTNQGVLFIVNDDIVVSPEHLKTAEGRRLAQQWQELKTIIANTEATLDQKRDQYHQNRSAQLAKEILSLEKDYQQQRQDIYTIEKQIRRYELQQ